MRGLIGFFGAIGVLFLQGLSWAADPVAVLTELRMEQGEVRVKLGGEADWRAPQPLLALRPGDQVRATGEGQAVLVFTGSLGTHTVTAANSPYVVQTPSSDTGTRRFHALLADVVQFLLARPKEPSYQSLSVRGLDKPPLILSPRQGRLLPGPVTFEWAGSDRLRYSVRVLGPQGLLWEQANLPRRPVSYPEAAPALQAGVQYVWELEARGRPAQQAHFELLPASEVERVQAALALLQPATLAGYPRNTVVLMRAGLLFQEGLHHDARRELLAGIAADPDEPTLHLLLGHVYQQVGLEELAAEAFDEAQFLASSKP